MIHWPDRWTDEELAEAAERATEEFRNERLSVSDAWDSHYKAARGKFDQLFRTLNLLNQGGIRDVDVAEAFEMGLGEALRYLAGPPISDDDLRVIAGVESMVPSSLGKNPEAVRRVMEVKQFGTSQVVPATVLAGVFKVLNLEQAQQRNLALFWSHDLGKLGDFIQSTR